MESQKNFYIIPNVSNTNLYTCLLSIHNIDYICQVSKNPIYFEAEPKLAQLLKGKEQHLQQALERSTTIDSFCTRLVHFIPKLLDSSSVNQIQLPPSYFRRVLEDIKKIGWNYISGIDPAFTYIEITLNDPKERKIVVRFSLDGTNYPNSKPKVDSNLPIPVNFDWNRNSSTLFDIIELYREKIQLLQRFWDQMDDLDNNTYVIEPAKPTLSCTYRRIVISQDIQIQIKVEPLKLMFGNDIHFFGADSSCRQMRTKYRENIRRLWRPDHSLRKNLETVLGVTLKKRDDTDFKDTDLECAYCFYQKLGSELPEVFCEQCKKKFHKSCLLDWFQTQSKVEHNRNAIYGSCPICDARIQLSKYNQY